MTWLLKPTLGLLGLFKRFHHRRRYTPLPRGSPLSYARDGLGWSPLLYLRRLRLLAHRALDPDALATTQSYHGCLELLQVELARVPPRPDGPRIWSKWWRQLLEALVQERQPPRRARSSPRVRKATRSHFPLKRAQKGGPRPKPQVIAPAAPSGP